MSPPADNNTKLLDKNNLNRTLFKSSDNNPKEDGTRETFTFSEHLKDTILNV